MSRLHVNLGLSQGLTKGLWLTPRVTQILQFLSLGRELTPSRRFFVSQSLMSAVNGPFPVPLTPRVKGYQGEPPVFIVNKYLENSVLELEIKRTSYGLYYSKKLTLNDNEINTKWFKQNRWGCRPLRGFLKSAVNFDSVHDISDLKRAFLTTLGDLPNCLLRVSARPPNSWLNHNFHAKHFH